MRAILEVDQLEKYYGSRGNMTKALDGLSFTLSAGEFVGVMGASGSGKTTLLNCISTIDRATSGRILLNGVEVTRLKSRALTLFRRNELGFIFQDFNLLDTLTGFENIALALAINHAPTQEVTQRVEEISGLLGVSHVLSKYPFQMSGGEKQRIAAARAIVTNPSLVLADEPTGALDSKSSRQLLESFDTLNKERGTTLLMVTHDAYTASYCHRILFIKDGKLFTELHRGNRERRVFFSDIIDVLTLLGGDSGHVL